MSLVALARQLGDAPAADRVGRPRGGRRRPGGRDRRALRRRRRLAAGPPRRPDADVYVTSDLRHHPASDARELMLLGRGPALIDVSHWATEWLWLDTAAAQLRRELHDVEVTLSDLRTDPWDFAVVPSAPATPRPHHRAPRHEEA